jgi:hypothetical protein
MKVYRIYRNLWELAINPMVQLQNMKNNQRLLCPQLNYVLNVYF